MLERSAQQQKQDEKRLQTALQTRQFEIDLFWKRSVFFWGFIGAAFVGIAALKNEQPVLSLVIAGLGTVCSISWTLVNRGSKYWQEQWESKVEDVEDFVTGPLFKRREPPQKKGWWLSGRQYSVSKLAIAISDYVLLVWIAIFARQVWLVGSLWGSYRHPTIAFLGAVPVIYSLVILLRSRSSDTNVEVNRMENLTKKEMPVVALYQTVSSRRISYDSLIWQTPILGLTAQAFLFTAALSHGNTHVARYIAASLAGLTSLMSMQLMSKHRHHEVIDNQMLQQIEKENDWPPFHGKSADRAKLVGQPRPWYVNFSSYWIWMAGLWAFLALAVALVFITWFRPDSL